MPLSTLRLVNLSQKLQGNLFDYLDILQYSKRTGTFENIQKVYAGLYNKFIAKYNAQTPGKILNLIPEEYSTNFTLAYDPKTLREYGVDLLASSEGSAGTTLPQRTSFTVDLLHTANTNGVRSILSMSKIYLNYTPIGVNNDLFEQEDLHPDDGLAFAERIKYTKRYKKYKNIFDSLLLKKYDDDEHAYIDMYTPNLLTEKQELYYENDILHRIGINLPVMFINDPGAFEDTILIDADIAKALGWDEGNKTWLGFYGFKGGVLYIKGLYAKYGAAFIANQQSVLDRSSFGAPLDLALNTIRKYLIMDKAGNGEYAGNKDLSDEVIALLKSKDKELRKTFTIRKGKMILDSGTNYEQKLLQIFGDKATIQKLFTKRIVGESISYVNTKGDLITKEIKDATPFIGELYVVMDAEHTAEQMSVKSQIDEFGELNIVYKDAQGSVRGGIMFGPTTASALESMGVDWKKALKPNYDNVRLYAELYNLGVAAFINKHRKKDEDISKTIETILLKDNNVFMDDIVKYLQFEAVLKDPDITDEDKRSIEYTLYSIDNKIRNQTLNFNR